MGNGSSLHISDIGSSIVLTDFRKLLMNNMLHTPCVANNLFFVPLIFRDNQVYFEFHAFYNLVKYSISHRTLLKVLEYGSLYKLDLASFVNFDYVS